MSERVLSRMMSDFCQRRIALVLPPRETENLRKYFLNLIATRTLPPISRKRFDWRLIADECSIDPEQMPAVDRELIPALEMLVREIPRLPPQAFVDVSKLAPNLVEDGRRRKSAESPSHVKVPLRKDRRQLLEPVPSTTERRGRRGVVPRPIVEFPAPTFEHWDDPAEFHAALELHMKRHGDTCWDLHRAIVKPREKFDRKTFQFWCHGAKCPSTQASFEILRRIERRYRPPDGYFRAKLPNPARALTGHVRLAAISHSERRRLAWHLPEDFNGRSREEKEAIVDWVRKVIITGSTDYRKYQATAMKQRFAIRFPGLLDQGTMRRPSISLLDGAEGEGDGLESSSGSPAWSGNLSAPPALMEEVADLIRFKTDTLTAVGYQRIGVWGEETASQKLEHLG